MAVSYNKLFNMLSNKKMTYAQLQKEAGVSGNILTRIRRQQYVSLKSIEHICCVLNCGVDDILEFVPEEGRRS